MASHGGKKTATDGLRDRIVGFERISSDEIEDHPLNWRIHGSEQKAALHGILKEIGKADCLLIYKSERAGGRWVAIDGHLRKNSFRGEWPCVITDLTDEEADKLLLTHDPISAMAHADEELFRQLREQTEFADHAVDVMLDDVEMLDKRWQDADGKQEAESSSQQKDDAAIPEMELKPYEHYDYLLVLCRTSFDWNWLVERLGLQKVNGTNDPRYRKIGLGRAIPADKLIEVLQEADRIIQADKERSRSRKKQSTK